MKSKQNLLLAGAVALSALATSGHAAVVFDNITPFETMVAGAVGTSVTSPNQFIGDALTLAAGTVDITGFDLFPVNLVTSTNYNALKLNFYVWGSVNLGTVNAANPAFGNLLGSYSVTSTGTFTTGYYYSFESISAPGVTPGITLTTPLVLSSPTIGLTVNVQGSTNGGSSFASVANLTSLLTYGAAPVVGTDLINGFYRVASSTTGNFTSGAVAFASQTNQGLAVRIYGDMASVPELGTSAMMGLGVAALLMARRRRA